MNYYYLNRNRQPVGPLTEDELKAAIRTEALVPDTLVTTEGSKEWVCLNSLPGMDDVLAAVEDSSMGACPQCGRDITGFCMPPNCPHCGFEMALPFGERDNLWRNFVFSLKKSFCLRGRATRMEYWSFFLFSGIIQMVVQAVAAAVIPLFFLLADTGGVWIESEEYEYQLTLAVVILLISLIPGLLMMIPYITVSVRRLHDIGASGWWIPAGLVSFGIPLLSLLIPEALESEKMFILYYALLSLVPMGIWCRIVISHFQDTQRGGNKYGASAKYPR